MRSIGMVMLTRTELRTPRLRGCERCERREVWSERNDGWRIDAEDGDRKIGDPHCIHEWDVDGTFSPFE
jgi:hypothetical protein